MHGLDSATACMAIRNRRQSVGEVWVECYDGCIIQFGEWLLKPLWFPDEVLKVSIGVAYSRRNTTVTKTYMCIRASMLLNFTCQTLCFANF
jgi:hypothetical protein